MFLGLGLLFFLHNASAQLSLSGHLVQGSLVEGRVAPDSRVKIDNRRVRVSKDGLFLIGFDRDHPGTYSITVISKDGVRKQRNLKIEKRKFRVQRINGLPKNKITPTKAEARRIRKESRQIKDALQRDDARTDFLSGWVWPVKGRISGVYGSQRILNGKPSCSHYGVDIAVPTGTRVRAPADGIVTLVHPGLFYYGKTVIIDHGYNLSSSFLHLSKALVKKGQRVRRGDVIAEVGSTGRSTGPHLDWRMNIRDAHVDPQLLMPLMPKRQRDGLGNL